MSKEHTAHEFVTLVDRGKLTRPSKSVVKVCMEAEKVLQRLLKVSGNALPKKYNVPGTVASAVLQNTGNLELFNELQSSI